MCICYNRLGLCDNDLGLWKLCSCNGWMKVTMCSGYICAGWMNITTCGGYVVVIDVSSVAVVNITLAGFVELIIGLFKFHIFLVKIGKEFRRNFWQNHWIPMKLSTISDGIPTASRWNLTDFLGRTFFSIQDFSKKNHSVWRKFLSVPVASDGCFPSGPLTFCRKGLPTDTEFHSDETSYFVGASFLPLLFWQAASVGVSIGKFIFQRKNLLSRSKNPSENRKLLAVYSHSCPKWTWILMIFILGYCFKNKASRPYKRSTITPWLIQCFRPLAPFGYHYSFQ